MPKKDCPICNKIFISSAQNRTYCSIKCSKESRKEKQSKYYKKYNKDPKNREAKKIREKLYFKNPENREKKYLQRKKKSYIYNQKYRSSQKGKEANRRGVKKAVKNNPIYKMSMNLRNRLNEFLNIKRLTKTNKTFDMVGCSPMELKKYLEKKFSPGMTWWNHSPKGWHIDHIIPLSSAKSYEDIVKLMHYKNLQPMWAKENISKSNKII